MPVTAQTPLSEVMSPAPLTVDAELPLADVKERMQVQGIRHLPVTREGNLVGIISVRDMMEMEALSADTAAGMCAADLMNDKIVCLETDSPVLSALREMHENKVGSVLVIENDELQGVFTERDCVGLLFGLLRD